MYTINLKVPEFHLIFGTLQNKMLENESKMNSLIRYENLYDKVINDQEEYNNLVEQNEGLNALLKKLYDDTNNQHNSNSL
jgi:hypothetical protein